MRVNRLLRILFLVALFRSANLPLRSLEAPPSCLGPHPKHRDRALLSRYRDTIARARASISMISNQISLPNLHTRGRRRNDRLFPRLQKGARSSGCIGDASPSRTQFLRCRQALQIQSRANPEILHAAKIGEWQTMPSNPYRRTTKLRAIDI